MSRPSAADPHPRRRVAALGATLAYVDTGPDGAPPVVFLHGNPTSSYLWRNVIPPVAAGGARCLAPDLVGMGSSSPAPDGRYDFADHRRYLDAWFDAVLPAGRLVLVLHDWGGALGFDWARRHAQRVRGIAYMETIVAPIGGWDDWPANARNIFQALRSPAGEGLIFEKNVFIEGILPNAILGGLAPEAHERYRAPFKDKARRQPMLSWPRNIPIGGEPREVAAVAADYAAWLAAAPVPKLFVNAEPGSILVGRQREACRRWPNQSEVTVRGAHFIQEDQPAEIGQAVAAFVARLAP